MISKNNTKLTHFTPIRSITTGTTMVIVLDITENHSVHPSVHV